MREKRIVLKDHSDAALFRGKREANAGHTLPSDAYFPGQDCLETGDRTQQRRLPATTGTE
jgi:hypothetical protein